MFSTRYRTKSSCSSTKPTRTNSKTLKISFSECLFFSDNAQIFFFVFWFSCVFFCILISIPRETVDSYEREKAKLLQQQESLQMTLQQKELAKQQEEQSKRCVCVCVCVCVLITSLFCSTVTFIISASFSLVLSFVYGFRDSKKRFFGLIRNRKEKRSSEQLPPTIESPTANPSSSRNATPDAGSQM